MMTSAGRQNEGLGECSAGGRRWPQNVWDDKEKEEMIKETETR